MPELPEVETTRRGIAPALEGRRILRLEVRERRLRWPIAPGLGRRLAGTRIDAVDRRAKYLLLRCARGSALIHLGMSGSLRIWTAPVPAPRPHEHYDIVMEGGLLLRYHDPRRFGCLKWIAGDPDADPLLAGLGPEPLGPDFGADYLYVASRGRRAPIKSFIMDGRVVVGVGNIYANEALFLARIDPRQPAGEVSRARCQRLVAAVTSVLGEAIAKGGTTLRDYVDGRGEQGWFGSSLQVYGRAGEPCGACGATVRRYVLGQRSTFQCPRCQRLARKPAMLP